MSYVQSAQVENPDGVTDEAAHIVLSWKEKYFILEEIDRLENYVLSFWVKGKTAGKMILNYGETDMEIDVTTDWQRVVFQFTAEWIDNIWIYFSGTEYFLYNTQLEIGNVPTDYSENPEEVKEKTNDKIEQYRKETQASIDLLSDSITLQVSALEEYVSTNYSTKRETEASIQLLSDQILSTVSENYATVAYADEATEAAKQSAIQTAGDTLNQRLLSYSTTTQMNSAINQKADSITSSVSKQITETRTYADTAATNAKNAAITDTTNKLKSYSTTTQMNSAIQQSATGILSTVSQTYATNGKLDEANTKISQVEQTASKISWLVKSGTSASDFELTDRTATLVSQYININGLVQFSGLDTAAQGKINTAQTTADGAKTAASNAQTAANNAQTAATSAKNRVDSWASTSDTTLIDGGKIYTGSITADKLKINDLLNIGATIGGWEITENAIKSTNEKGTVALYSKNPENGWVLRITDTGSGYFYIDNDLSMMIYGNNSLEMIEVTNTVGDAIKGIVSTTSDERSSGVRGESWAEKGYGVYGFNMSGGCGVYGESMSGGYGVYSRGKMHTTGALEAGSTLTVSGNSTLNGTLTVKKDVTFGNGTDNYVSIRLGNNEGHTRIGFFGKAAQSIATVSKLSTTTTAVSTIVSKVNALITALNGYGLIKV